MKNSVFFPFDRITHMLTVLWTLGMWQWVTSRKIRAGLFQAHCPNSLPIGIMPPTPTLSPPVKFLFHGSCWGQSLGCFGVPAFNNARRTWRGRIIKCNLIQGDLLVASPCVPASYTLLTMVPFRASITWASVYLLGTELRLKARVVIKWCCPLQM